MADENSAGIITVQAAVELIEGCRAPSELLGGKGAALARLIEADFPVPATGVITTEAYLAVADHQSIHELVDRLKQGASIAAAEVDATFAAAPVPEWLRRQIGELARTIGGGGPIAVRSSATAEDLHGSSFAGQYQSFLDIDSTDVDAVVAAVAAVWASLWHPAPNAYRRALGVSEDDAAMAVVLMRMIPATTAGVVFTQDPAGADGKSRIEAVRGLGESLVSGAETPDAWVVSQDPPWPDLPSGVGGALELALQAEQLFGTPQDVEWAAHGDRVFVVQSRPITVLEDDDGFDSPVDDHELTTAGIVEMIPGVLAPLWWEINSYLLEEAFRSFLDNLGIIRGSAAEGDPFVRRVRGRAALDFSQLRDAASAVEGAAGELERQYFGSSDETEQDLDQAAATAPTRIRRWLRRFAQDARAVRTRSRVTEQADVVIGAARHLDSDPLDLDDLDDEAILAYLERLIDLSARGVAAELGVAAASVAAYQRIERQLAPHLGESEAARQAQLVTTGAAAQVERHQDGSAAIYGGPTWADLGTEHATNPSSAEESPTNHLTALRSTLQGLPNWRRNRILTGQVVDVRCHLIERSIRDARDQLRRREAAKAAFLRLGGEARRVHGELGRRFRSRGLLVDEHDIELLTTGEIRQAVDERRTPPHDVLRRRRNWLTRYETEGPLPLRFTGEPSREPLPLPEGDILSGWASSPGRYSGRARVIRKPTQTIEPGEVLVATATDASWSPLFVRAGAVVVEQGGPLSHAAILSRELGLPAVLNIADATRRLDGRMVTVDGDQGTVVLAPGADESEGTPQ